MIQPQPVRLQKLIAEATDLSRRAAERAIAAGEVKVNGRIVKTLGTKVYPDRDRVSLRDQLLQRPSKKRIYLAYYKTKNTIVSKYDPEGRITIWDKLKDLKWDLNSAGRLDYDSEGLLILTNDGGLINHLTHPSHEIWKTYEAKIKGMPRDADLAKLREGVNFDGISYLPSVVKILRQDGRNTWLQIQIREGKNRQVRKMCAAIGYDVLKLKRVAIGNVWLKDLKPGAWRRLTIGEIKNLTS